MPSPDDRLPRLLRINASFRWLIILMLWLTVGSLSIWALRTEIDLWLEYFTWSAVRSALRTQLLPFLGLGLCVGMTLSTLIWHSGHILFGVSATEKRSLHNQLAMIEKWSPAHPFYAIKKFIFK